MNPLFCDACGDQVKAVYPCKFVFHDKRFVDLNICPQCMKYGSIKINLPRKRLVSIVLGKLVGKKAKKKWNERSRM